MPVLIRAIEGRPDFGDAAASRPRPLAPPPPHTPIHVRTPDTPAYQLHTSTAEALSIFGSRGPLPCWYAVGMQECPVYGRGSGCAGAEARAAGVVRRLRPRSRAVLLSPG